MCLLNLTSCIYQRALPSFKQTQPTDDPLDSICVLGRIFDESHIAAVVRRLHHHDQIVSQHVGPKFPEGGEELNSGVDSCLPVLASVALVQQ
jgi:hypothetical protein